MCSSYPCAVADTFWSVFEWKRVQEPEEALNQHNHSFSHRLQVLSREMDLLLLLLIFIHLHLRVATDTKLINSLFKQSAD